jgi:hypothetical protein
MYRHGDLILIPSKKKPAATTQATQNCVLAEGEENRAQARPDWRPHRLANRPQRPDYCSRARETSDGDA